jgi:hypothetical protein
VDVKGIKITHISPDGAAARAGILQIGDVIVEVCLRCLVDYRPSMGSELVVCLPEIVIVDLE